MKMVIEYACEKCGAPLMKPATQTLSVASPKAGNSCDECGHVTDVANMARFQWPPSLKSMVDKLCNPLERKQLRLDPEEFVSRVLISKLRALAKPPVELDATTVPVTIRFK
jgi:hypothetical protein